MEKSRARIRAWENRTGRFVTIGRRRGGNSRTSQSDAGTPF